MFCIAYTGMAASLLVNGKTIHGLLQIPIPKESKRRREKPRVLQPLPENKLVPLQEQFRKCMVLLIDETSMLDPILLYHLHTRCCQIKDSSKPFGGMAILLVGVFFQLPPVLATSLFTACTGDMDDFYVGTPFQFGVDLVAKFQMITFTEQFRSDDPNHTATINQIRSSNNPTPIDATIIDSLKVLSAEDVANDDSWFTAPVVVCSNRERHALNISQAKRFAMKHGVPILRWKRELCNKDVLADLGNAYCDMLYSNEPELMGIFVYGAPAILNDNLNPTAGLANGTPLVLHSIVFSEDEDIAHWEALIDATQPGEIIDIPVPYAVNVSVPSIDPVIWLRDGHKSVVEGIVVIPLTNKQSRTAVDLGDKNKVLYKSHGHDLSFSVTFHKMQGQTADKIILDLNKRPQSLGFLNFYAFYVGISRVKYGNNIRILPCHDIVDGLKHLLKLKPHDSLQEWLDSIVKY
jgi:hypothetical protein